MSVTTGVVNLTVKQGDTFERLFTFTRNGGPLDLTAYVLRAEARAFAGDPAAVPVLEFQILLPGPTHQRVLRVDASVTAALAARQYWWDLSWVDPSNDTQTPLEGVFTVTPQASP